ncbi:kinase-like domain-containing protein [Massariosphaeria phaeospora]|uniref:Kinase-like domain-containing protein n=1 Tax=Massariosphaeria phaeospora TaxID=100035 RepID=A0A7C8IIC8_9PLEO|nr:kinase-like domain-containing protein [Massariosphaeria phaeospora]
MHFIKREVKIGEILRKHPHPNLCAYKGVVLDRANRVVGIAYQRYEASLDHYLRFGKAFEKDLMLNSVTQAVKHMHALGLVHCDVHPANIFITRGASDQPDQVVLGDFDAVHSFGERMSTKIGRVEYTPSGFSWGVPVDKSVDEYGLSILEQKIRGPKFPPASAFRAYMNANFFGKTS